MNNRKLEIKPNNNPNFPEIFPPSPPEFQPFEEQVHPERPDQEDNK